MLHARIHKSCMTAIIKQFILKHIKHIYSMLRSNCPHWTPYVVQEIAERIFATIGQENICHNWTGEYHKPLTREMLNKNKQENI